MSASCSSRVRFEVRTTAGCRRARIVPSSGIVIWKSDSTSSRNASNSSSARSISSMSSTTGSSRLDRLEQRPADEELRAEELLLGRPCPPGPRGCAGAGAGSSTRRRRARRRGPRSTGGGSAARRARSRAPSPPRSCRRRPRPRAAAASRARARGRARSRGRDRGGSRPRGAPPRARRSCGRSPPAGGYIRDSARSCVGASACPTSSARGVDVYTRRGGASLSPLVSNSSACPASLATRLTSSCCSGSTNVIPTPARPGAACPADAVDVARVLVRRVEVDDVRDLDEVEPARGDVGGDERRGLARLEALERPLALALRSCRRAARPRHLDANASLRTSLSTPRRVRTKTSASPRSPRGARPVSRPCRLA